MPQKCIFCQIIKGKQESERVYEGKNVLGILDIRPSAPGHTLVIPKEHVAKVSDLSEGVGAALFSAVDEVIWKLEKGLNPDGFNVGWNQGKAAGQAVPHLHIHVIPRYEGDKGGPIQALVRNEPEEEISAIAQKIRNAGKPPKQRSRVGREAEKKEGEEKEKAAGRPEKKQREEVEEPSMSRPDLERIPGSDDELMGLHEGPTPQEVERKERKKSQEESKEEEEEESEEESDEKRKWKEMKKPRY